MPHAAYKSKPASETFCAPPVAALLAMAAYLLLCLPILAARHGDPSVFVNAGDRYVDAAQTTPRLPVRAHSDGYDGQFYYRMAQHPFSLAPVEGGITLDHPAKRLERFLYPLLAWAVSLGGRGGTAWAMFGLNLFGLGVIAFLVSDLARRQVLPAVLPLAVMLWPGFVVTLMHDTTEIVSTVFLVGAVWAYLRGRLGLYAALAVAATLARETTIPVLIGVLGWEVFAGWKNSGAWRRICLCGAALLPFVVWREVLAAGAHGAAQVQQVAQDLDWPFFGFTEMVWACLTGSRHWASTPFKDLVVRGVVLATAPALLAFCALVALRLRRISVKGRWGGIAVGWVLTALLMSLLSAGGPWIDPVAYFRAFTDCFVVGCLLLAAAGSAPRLRWVALFGGAELLLVWCLCLTKLR